MMQIAFVKSLFNFVFGGGSTPTYPLGEYTIINESLLTVDQRGQRFNTQTLLSTDFSAAVFNYNVTEVPVSTDFSGINRRFISDDGTYDFAQAANEFQRMVPGLRISRTEIEALARSSIVDDSHEAYILNMLISWFLATIYKQSNGIGKVAQVKKRVYSDSHVEIPFSGAEADVLVDYSLGPPVDSFPDVDIVQRMSSTYWEKPLVLRYPGESRKAATFYLMHLYGREKRSSISADIDIPAVDFDNLSLDPVGGKFYAFNPDDVEWDNPTMMWVWIRDYVVLNRVEHAFAAALELLSAMAFHPMPSFQESTVWERTALNINLARFTPTRARIPANLEGEPYKYDNEAKELMSGEALNPSLYLLAGSILNYAMWYGLYSIMDNEITSCDDWRAKVSTGSDSLSIIRSKDMRSAIASVLFGKEVITVCNDNAFMTFDPRDMPFIPQLAGYKVKEDGYPKTLPLEILHPYVSGALLHGTVSVDLRTCAHLRSSGTVATDDAGAVSPEDACILASIYRLFGHEVSMGDGWSRTQYDMYANSRESILNVATVLQKVHHSNKITLFGSQAREGRNALIMPIGLHKYSAETHYTTVMPMIRVVKCRTSNTPVRHMQVLQDRRKPVVFNVSGRKVVFHEKLSHLRIRPQMDFYEGHGEVAPQQAQIAISSAPAREAPTEPGVPVADDVG
nr:putative capsid protein [Poaceae Liege totivirus 2]